ncbi:MAG TPA: PASTA domain-containing protein [Terriglobales bacterium]|nr:PASTA domain-containing protein [Terriglobales bacterium]
MRRFFRYLLMALVLLTVMLFSAMTAMRMAIHGREVATPKLLGLSMEQAERVASDSGLLLDTESRFYSDTVPEGRIVTQLPAPGTRVRRGWRMRLALSLGPQRAVIPDLAGQSPRAAEINVRRRGLDVGVVAVAHIPDAAPDQVLAQSPPANATSVASPKVNLLVSAPEESQAYVMPNLRGRQLADAAQALQQAGLKLGTVTATEAGATPGTILKQSPAPGQRVTPGMTVNFEVTK